MVRLGFRLVVLLAALALVAVGCGGGGVPAVASPITFEALKDSARRSADASSGRFAFGMEMSMPGFAEPFAFTGEGAFDSAAEKTSMSIDLSSFAELMKGMASAFGGSGAELDADDWRIDGVVDGLVMYMRMPFIADKLPAGKEWVRIDLAQAAAQLPGVDVDQFLQFAGHGPESTLDYLRAVSGPITPVGVETVRGESATRYSTTIDVRKYGNLATGEAKERLDSMLDQLVAQTGLDAIPVDVWIGEDGLVRRLEMTFAMTQPGSTERLEASMTFELFDYGKPVEIILPLESETVDVSALR
jgi:hypothetical protein